MYPKIITDLPTSSHPFCVRLNKVPTARHSVSDRTDYVMKVNFYKLYIDIEADRPGYALRYISRMTGQVNNAVK